MKATWHDWTWDMLTLIVTWGPHQTIVASSNSDEVRHVTIRVLETDLISVRAMGPQSPLFASSHGDRDRHGLNWYLTWEQKRPYNMVRKLPYWAHETDIGPSKPDKSDLAKTGPCDHTLMGTFSRPQTPHCYPTLLGKEVGSWRVTRLGYRPHPCYMTRLAANRLDCMKRP